MTYLVEIEKLHEDNTLLIPSVIENLPKVFDSTLRIPPARRTSHSTKFKACYYNPDRDGRVKYECLKKAVNGGYSR